MKYELLGYVVSKVKSQAGLPKSIQSTSALTKFTSDIDVLRTSLKYHVHAAGRKLREDNCYCQTVGVMLRTKDFTVYSNYIKLAQPTNGEQELFKAAQSLLPKIYLPNILYRSSGVMLEHLLSANDFQPNLFSVTEYKDDKISRVLDDLEKRFGKDVVKNGLF